MDIGDDRYVGTIFILGVVSIALLLALSEAVWTPLNLTLSSFSSDFPLRALFSNTGIIAIVFGLIIIMAILGLWVIK